MRPSAAEVTALVRAELGEGVDAVKMGRLWYVMRTDLTGPRGTGSSLERAVADYRSRVS